MTSKIRKAVLPVAGLGTRFLPITKSIPKEMLPIVDKPMIQLIVDEALASGIEQIILINGHHKGNIEDYFDTNYELNDMLLKKGDKETFNKINAISYQGFICSLRQKEAKGLGHAILSARPLLDNEPFAVLLGDDLVFTDEHKKPAIAQLMQNFQKTGTSQVALLKIPRSEIHKYGAAEGTPDKKNPRQVKINNLVEKPKPGTEKTDLAVIGRYVLTPTIWPNLEKQKPGVNGEIQITDALASLIDQEGLFGYCFEGERIDAGDRLGYLHANLKYALERDDIKKEVRALIKSLL